MLTIAARPLTFRLLPVCLAALIAATGCRKLERPAIPQPISAPAYSYSDFTADYKSYKCASSPAAGLDTNLCAGSKTGDESIARALRDRMAYAVLSEIEFAYRSYEGTLFANLGNLNVGADFIELGLAAAGTVSHGERGKTILSALVSGVTGTRLSIDKNFFRQQTVTAIISSMQANRNRIRAIILQRLASEGADTYPFEAARSDLIDLFFAGTLQGGIQELHQASSANAQQGQAEMESVMLAVPASKQDLTDAMAMNKAITAALKSSDSAVTARLVAFLKAMGADVTDASPKSKLEQEYRALAKRTNKEAALRAKWYQEAKNTGFVQ